MSPPAWVSALSNAGFARLKDFVPVPGCISQRANLLGHDRIDVRFVTSTYNSIRSNSADAENKASPAYAAP